jgi:hypothetical protein
MFKCYFKFKDAEIAVKIAEAVVHQMNVDLQASEFASKCVNLTVNRLDLLLDKL